MASFKKNPIIIFHFIVKTTASKKVQLDQWPYIPIIILKCKVFYHAVYYMHNCTQTCILYAFCTFFFKKMKDEEVNSTKNMRNDMICYDDAIIMIRYIMYLKKKNIFSTYYWCYTYSAVYNADMVVNDLWNVSCIWVE